MDPKPVDRYTSPFLFQHQVHHILVSPEAALDLGSCRARELQKATFQETALDIRRVFSAK